MRLSWFLCGVLAAGALAFIGGAVFLLTARGLSAREEPSAVERWIARRARLAAIPAGAAARSNPVPNTPEVLAEARAHWADHCASCHGNDGSGESMMGKRTYPPAPDMRLPETQQMSDGALFYVIQNGVRMTAMPAWGSPAGSSTPEASAHDEMDSWKLVRFIRHLPNLTFEEKTEMQKLNPKSPDDLKEEEEEQKFLQGDDSNVEQTHHHHH